MTPYIKAVSISICKAGFIVFPIISLGFLTSRMSATPDFAKELSVYFSVISLFLLAISFIVYLSLKKTFVMAEVKANAKLSKMARGSLILSFPLFGLMSWGVASIFSIFMAIFALKNIYMLRLKGEKEANYAIIISASTIAILLVIVLFLGP
jgi:hypothetical protein